ncbi:MAG: S9 family peptidase [Robiginitomaculum sp.]|nr:S9 family peptidase [Robiginitomaculum sp.]
MAYSFSFASAVLAKPSVENFGALPEVSKMALSPNGRHIAYLYVKSGRTDVLIRDLFDLARSPQGLDVSKVKVRHLEWVNERYLLLYASTTTNILEFRTSKTEYGGVYSYDIKRKKLKRLFTNTLKLGINSSLGTVSGYLLDSEEVLMPAFNVEQRRVLFRVSLKTGRGQVYAKGRRSNTREFIANKDGKVVARIDFSNRDNLFSIKTKHGNSWNKIYQEKTDLAPLSVVGLSQDGTGLLFVDNQGTDKAGLFQINLSDGEVSGSVLRRNDADIILAITPLREQSVSAVGFASTNGTEYQFLNPDRQRIWQTIVDKIGLGLVHPINWSDELETWLVLVVGDGNVGRYVLYTASTGKMMVFAKRRTDIPKASVGDVVTIKYKSAGDHIIHAVLTQPPGYSGGKLPLVVLPHGGPASYDSVGWDYMAQYLANEGYLVFQPNYRGSSGSGQNFEIAGHGKWNTDVLADVNNGVQALVRSGYADADNICIVGASYGGYLALAAITFTPEIYKCAVAIAPLTDAPEFLRYQQQTYGKNSQSATYWQKAMAGSDGKTTLENISPALHVKNVSAPVLLIHGKDDTVVPIAQSRIMNRALKVAGKQSKLIQLQGGDHWLSRAQTRTRTLAETGEFLRQHLDRSDKLNESEP